MDLAVNRAPRPESRFEIGAMAMFLFFVLGAIALVAFGRFRGPRRAHPRARAT